LQGHYGLAEHSAETEVIANMDDDDVMDLCHEDITDSSTSARPFHSVMHTEESDKSLEKRKNKRRKVQLKRPKTESPLDSSPASQQLKLKSSNGSVQKVPKNKGKSVNDAICLISDDEEEVHSIAENGSDEIEVIVPEGEINASSDPRVVLKRWSELFRQYPPINKGAVSTKKPIIAPTIPKTKLVSPSPQSLTTSSKIDEDDYIDTPPFVVNVNDSKKTEPTIVIGGYISYKLKPHQKEAVQFMWTSIMGTNILSNLKEVVSSNTSTDSNVDTFQNKKLIKRREDIVNGSGCILAHCMGLGKSFSVIALVITLFTNEVVKSELRLKDRPLIYRYSTHSTIPIYY
jgi:transcriptional regulator ATRX